MSNKIVVVTDHNVSKELDLICSIYPNSEVFLFSSGNDTLLVFTKIRTTRPTGGSLQGYKPL